MAEPPVLIAGAGPVGLMLALGLARAGHPVEVFEARPDQHDQPRAATIHPSTLDMMDDYGLYAEIEPQGLVAPIVHYWDRAADALIAAFDHAVLDGETRHPWVLQCEQNKIEQSAYDLLRAFPHAAVHFATPLVGLSQGPDAVSATVAGPDGTTRTVSGRYLVGCDGGRSVVRETLGIAFEGFTYADRAVIIGTPFDFMAAKGYALRNYFSDPDQWANLFKISWTGSPGVWRLVLPTRPEEPEEEILSQAGLQERLQRFHRLDGDYEITLANLYTVHQRVAADFRKGRIVLAGDAAHINSPIGGLGMNTGLHDAVNLAEKLDRLLRGEAEDAILDRYTRQRRHVALAHTKAQTMRNKQRLEARDPAVRKRNHDALRAASRDPPRAKAFLMRTALIDGVREAALIE